MAILAVRYSFCILLQGNRYITIENEGKFFFINSNELFGTKSELWFVGLMEDTMAKKEKAFDVYLERNIEGKTDTVYISNNWEMFITLNIPH